MKNIWKKLPAWLKAILINIVLLFPVVILVQTIIQINLQSQWEWGWGLILVLGILTLYWYLAKKYNSFHKAGDNKLELTFDTRTRSNWLLIGGLFFVVPAVIQLAAFLFDIQSTQQTAYIESFKSFDQLIAIPMLLALALTAGIVEEVTFRGFVQNTLTRNYSRWFSILMVAVIFALMHFLPLTLIPPYIVVSILFSLVAERTKSTAVVIYAHVLIDFVAFLLMYYDLASTEATLTQVVVNLALLVLGMSMLLVNLYQPKKPVSISIES